MLWVLGRRGPVIRGWPQGSGHKGLLALKAWPQVPLVLGCGACHHEVWLRGLVSGVRPLAAVTRGARPQGPGLDARPRGFCLSGRDSTWSVLLLRVCPKEFDLFDKFSCCLLVERNSTWSVLLLSEIWGSLPVQEAAPVAARLQEVDCSWPNDCGRSHHMRPVSWHAVRRLPAGGLLYLPVARTMKFGCLLKA